MDVDNSGDEIIDVESCLPPADECLKLCDTFEEFTETNKALAMMFLQQNSWDLELAIGAYFAKQEPMECGSGRNSKTEVNTIIDLESTTDSQHADLFRVLSWNIDGLSERSRDFRTHAVIRFIKEEKFHIVCLQEVVRATLLFLEFELVDHYIFFYPDDISLRDYFPVLIVRRHAGINIDNSSFKVTRFPNSVMQRVFLSLEVDIVASILLPDNNKSVMFPSLRVCLWTSHLESCHNFAKERMQQLQQVWQEMKSRISSESTSSSSVYGIFCGDMNIRDSEIKQLGGLPDQMLDVWQTTGARPEARLTWDPRRNSNLALEDPTRPPLNCSGMRFDRMYCLGTGLRPVDFELRGLEKIPNRQYFPSDHWAILSHFDLA